MADHVRTYLTRLTLAGFRPQTVQVRGIVLKSFARTVPSIVWAERADIETFLARPLAPASRRAYASHLRSFYRYLIDEELRSDDPTERLPHFRVPKALPRPLPVADLALALDRADPRMAAWLLCMSLAGLRCVEVAALRPADLLITDRGSLLHLREVKGGGEGFMPAHPAVVAALERLPVRGGTWWNVSARTVSNAVGVHLRSLGIDATAHQLRHRFGTDAFEVSGRDLLATKAVLRHRTVGTVEVYAEINPNRPAEVVSLLEVPVLAGR
jgi:integrase/recombinase XerC